MGEKASMWNLWHGCHKLSEGCRHCYVYRTDGKYGKDSSVVTKTEKFDLPLQRKKNGTYKIPSGNLVYTCFTSDFLIEDADEWRAEAWEMMQIRQDLRFLFITKRIDRLQQCLPPDWGDGYDNVTICCTMENQDRVDYRLPIYKEMPIKHKIIICEPLLSRIDFRGELGEWVEQVVAGGESGKEVRVCDYEWVLDIRPILYYLEYFSDGTHSSFGAFLNPALCWGGLLSLFVLIYTAIFRRDRCAGFILLGYLAQLIPWLFVTRITFEYHYFPCSVFLVLSLGYCFNLMRHNLKHWKWYVSGFVALSIALFVMFYPALSGKPVAATGLLSWLPTWPF